VHILGKILEELAGGFSLNKCHRKKDKHEKYHCWALTLHFTLCTHEVNPWKVRKLGLKFWGGLFSNFIITGKPGCSKSAWLEQVMFIFSKGRVWGQLAAHKTQDYLLSDLGLIAWLMMWGKRLYSHTEWRGLSGCRHQSTGDSYTLTEEHTKIKCSYLLTTSLCLERRGYGMSRNYVFHS
jgi:hypothetical protein